MQGVWGSPGAFRLPPCISSYSKRCLLSARTPRTSRSRSGPNSTRRIPAVPTRDPVVGPHGLQRTSETPERPPCEAPHQNFKFVTGHSAAPGPMPPGRLGRGRPSRREALPCSRPPRGYGKGDGFVVKGREPPKRVTGALSRVTGACIGSVRPMSAVRLELFPASLRLLNPASRLRMCFYWTRRVTRALESIWGRFWSIPADVFEVIRRPFGLLTDDFGHSRRHW